MTKEKIISVEYKPTPNVIVRTISEDDTSLQKKSKVRYPYELLNNVEITVKTNKRDFSFKIYRGYVWDGATIPKIFWSIVGASTSNDFLIPSLVHDYLLEFKPYIAHSILHYGLNSKEYRELTTNIFEDLLLGQGVNKAKAKVMAMLVDIYQSTICKNTWNVV